MCEGENYKKPHFLVEFEDYNTAALCVLGLQPSSDISMHLSVYVFKILLSKDCHFRRTCQKEWRLLINQEVVWCSALPLFEACMYCHSKPRLWLTKRPFKYFTAVHVQQVEIVDIKQTAIHTCTLIYSKSYSCLVCTCTELSSSMSAF